MSTQTNFTATEWNTLLQAPGLAVVYIIQSSSPGRDLGYRQMIAGINAIIAPAAPATCGQLVQSVRAALSAGQRPSYPPSFPHDLGEARAIALEGCRQAASLLAQRAPEDEAEEYGRWIMAIATTVAEVANEPARPGPQLEPAALETLAAVLQLSTIFIQAAAQPSPRWPR